MVYTDTRDESVRASFREAVTKGMNEKTGGLYMPLEIPSLEKNLLNKTPAPSFRELAISMAKPFVGDEIPESDLMGIIEDAYPFTPKIVPLDVRTYVLELFHGPTCAFKDFGARFMARVMSYFNKDENKPLHILVATSGDTGSAVGSAFHGVEGLDVTILYPAGKVSEIQEKQLATFTGNVRALKVAGTFDDCQKLVKCAFTDTELRKQLRLSSANSINIARLLPQSFYYMYASLVVQDRIKIDSKIDNAGIIVSVPSGNFGNMTSGLIAKKMGAPIVGFIAATNANHTFLDWLATGEYKARASIETYANAMDVGAPSNFERLSKMYSFEEAKKLFAGFWLSNDGIISAIENCYNKTGYTLDPHGAIAWKAWNEIENGALEMCMQNNIANEGATPNLPAWENLINEKRAIGIALETAHPAKFSETVFKATRRNPAMPDRLVRVLSLPNREIAMNNNYDEFKEILLS